MRREIRSLTLANMMCAASSPPSSPNPGNTNKQYDYLLKFLLVGDSDVGKEEILSGLSDGAGESPYGYSNGEIVPFVPSACVVLLRLTLRRRRRGLFITISGSQSAERK